MYKSKFFMQLSIFLFSLFFLSACGSNNSQSRVNLAPDNNNTAGGGSTEIANLTILNSNTDIVTVAKDSQNVNISILARDKNNVAVDGADILVQYPDKPLGSFSSKTAGVSSGLASFSYTAPPNLKELIDSGITQEQFTFYAYDSESNKADTSVVVVLTVKFDLTADSTSDDKIVNIVLTPQTFKVTNPGQKVTINIKAYNQNGFGVKNDIVQISDAHVFGSSKGSVPNSATIIAGSGSFVYTAPTNFPEDTDNYRVSTTSSGAVGSVSQDLTIEFGPHTLTPTLTVDNGPATLTKDGETVSVVVIAKDSSGVPLKKGSIEVLYPAGTSVGTFAKSQVKINDGIANFSFTGPSPLLTQNAKIFTFRFVENPSQRVAWSVSYSPTVPTSTDQIVTLSVDNNITVNTAGESKTIKVAAFYANNVPALTGKIRVSYPEASGSIGSFSPLVADVSNGFATFTYTAPSPLVTSPDKIFTFSVIDGAGTATDSMSVSYSPIVVGAVKPKTILVFENNKITSDTNITKNGEIKTFQIQVWGEDDQPFEGGNVKIKFPITEINNGVDVGYFGETAVACKNGKAEFTYNAPSDLGNRSDSFTFNFYHDSTDSLAGEKPLTVHMNPDPGQIVITTYELKLIPADGNLSMELNSTKAFTAKVVDKDGNEIGDGDGNFTITSLNQDIGYVINTAEVKEDPLLISDERNAAFRIKTKTLSGLIPIKVDVTFTDVNGNPKTISKVFNVVVFSGPPTAISISYASTGQEKDIAKFVEHMVVSVTDKYSNPVNTRPAISVSAIIGYVGGGGYPSQYMYYEPDGTTTGTITPGHFNVNSFPGGAKTFNNGDYNNDVLAVMSKEFTYDASGKWDVTYNSATSLNLVDTYDGTSRNNLGFALGNNHRPQTCSPGVEWLGYAEVEDGKYQLDENGNAKVSITYDYYLTGKDIVLMVNILGYQADLKETVRIGEARKITLRGHGLVPDTHNVAKLATGHVTFLIGLSDTESIDYFDARFISNLETSGTVTVSNVTVNTVGDCSNGTGQAYISMDYSGGADGGIISIKPVVANEF